MTATIAPQTKPDPPESDQWSALDQKPTDTTRQQADARFFDPTQGRKIGSHPYDDPTHGRKIGSDPYDDPTRARG